MHPTESLREVSPPLSAKVDEVLSTLRTRQKVLVAFSGGVDSTLVAFLARLALDGNAIAVTARSPSIPDREINHAKEVARSIGIRHVVIETKELDDPNYISNPVNRCYFCKKELSRVLVNLAKKMGCDCIVDGTNSEDLRGHRPGAGALAQAGILRPLASAGFSKQQVREAARHFRLPNAEKPSSPCLSSRIEYGEVITPERLRRVAAAEAFIRSRVPVRDLRVRDHGNLARIEFGRNERSLFFDDKFLDELGAKLRKLGFSYVTIDVLGYRSGSMNELATTQAKIN